ncbi:chloramphenicol resistance permease RarD [Marinobacterium nitratireducens]|uniref:Chloramphenicol resistance permease RarD n=1 Tax=Marinobacterium nitratireducens TaxID=518897 RepID=A0A918DWT7_9GAMM|nr:EamA family transporter RarD [Marinobacterium nitratireducens]GGO86226.1 chloramphenicol resistance permease RarD [Marinobacterium nitratireducens]
MNPTAKSGALFAITAYSLWGVAPVYFKLLQHVPATEILAHRVVWSFVLTLGLIGLLRRRDELMTALRSGRVRLALLLSTSLIALNWGVFIWAVNNDYMLSASLGYYINPLINILLGMMFFRERLDRVSTIAAALCVAAVLFELVQFGRLPWIALVLATTFGLYGLVRKKIGVSSFTGMALETGILLPLAAGYLLFSSSPAAGPADDSGWTQLMLFAAGPVTMVPLMCFAAAANRISLTALGFFQYIGPSGIFLLAVFAYGEPLSPEKLVTFGLIWSALALLTLDSLIKLRRAPVVPAP